MSIKNKKNELQEFVNDKIDKTSSRMKPEFGQ